MEVIHKAWQPGLSFTSELDPCPRTRDYSLTGTVRHWFVSRALTGGPNLPSAWRRFHSPEAP